MEERRIEISDTPQGQEPDGAAANAPGEPESPYRNLWVPLVIVPAGIVISVVLVFSLFGALAGTERSLGENLDLVTSGGKNERSQALFALVQQLGENHLAQVEGRDLPWAVPEGFLARVATTAGDTDVEDRGMRLTLGIFLATQGESQGTDILLETLALAEDVDPGGHLRFQAVADLAYLREARAIQAVIDTLGRDDEGLRTLAAATLGRIPGGGADAAVRAALRGVLDDPSIDVRGTAAISLSHLDPPDPEGARVLRDLLDPALYSAANKLDREKYRRGSSISKARVRAVEALVRLGLEEDRALLEALRTDEDVAVSEAAMRASKGADE